MNYKTFPAANQTGQEAVNRVASFLEAQPHHISLSNVEGDPFYQSKDIDLVWRTTIGTTTIEVKGDTHDEKNFFVETVSNQRKNTPGWFLYSAAQWICYLFLKTSTLFILPLNKMREQFQDKLHKFREANGWTSIAGSGYKSVGRLIPIGQVQGARRVCIP